MTYSCLCNILRRDDEVKGLNGVEQGWTGLHNGLRNDAKLFGNVMMIRSKWDYVILHNWNGWIPHVSLHVIFYGSTRRLQMAWNGVALRKSLLLRFEPAPSVPQPETCKPPRNSKLLTLIAQLCFISVIAMKKRKAKLMKEIFLISFQINLHNEDQNEREKWLKKILVWQS